MIRNFIYVLVGILFTTYSYAQTECANGTDPITGNAGDLVNYTVPADANTVTLTVKGADGGNTPQANGGSGATITASFPVCPECTVKPGSTIVFALGGAGESSTDFGGAGGGGASVAYVDGSLYPLIIAGGGGGAGNTEGARGEDEYGLAATLAGSGGTQNLGGGAGGGGGAIDTNGTSDASDDTTNNGNNSLSGTSAGTPGGALAGFISQGGNGGSPFGAQNGAGRDGGIGGGGAGGDGYNSFIGDRYGAGGAGGGYIGGDGSAGQNGSAGGTSYTYPERVAGSLVQTEGTNGGSTGANGSGSVCYTSNASAANCSGANQLLNAGFGDYGNIDQPSKDIYVDDSSICFASWERVGSFENDLGNSEGAVCSRVQFDAGLSSGQTASGTLSQTVANICKSQQVDLCFDLQGVWAASATSEVIVTLGGQEYVRFYDNNGTRTYEDGANADNVTVVNQTGSVNKEPGDGIVSIQTYKVCITDFNYDGTIPAELKLAFTNTNNGGGEDVINIDNFSLVYSNVGAPVLKDETTLSERPGTCVGTFDLTTMAPDPVADGLILSYKDASGNVVTDPTSVASGTYSVCYTRDASNPACNPNSGCLDEVCTTVTVTCATDTDGDGISDVDEGYDASNPTNSTDTDGDGVPDYLDADSDNDGIPDSVEGNVDTDGDGVPDYRDLDSDNDGKNDVEEGGDAAADTNGDGVIDSNDTGFVDANGDGQADGTTSNDGSEPDSDSDGIPDYKDPEDGTNNDTTNGGTAPTYPTGTDTDGDGILDTNDSDPNNFGEEADTDGDGIPDSVEKGADPNNPTDTDGDGIPDYKDLDSDNDGIPDSVEAGSDGANPVDTDGDGVPDYKDLDSDNDGKNDVEEGGDAAADTNGDGVIDSNDTGFVDADGDGQADGTTSNDGSEPDSDSDGIPDYKDPEDGTNNDPTNGGTSPTYPTGTDSDGDGILDDNDANPTTFGDAKDTDGDGIPDSVEGDDTVDTDGDGIPDYKDLDSDNDGIPDSVERGDDGANPVDSDGDGIPDYKDLDSDNDGKNDIEEAGGTDADGDGQVDDTTDADGDGLADSVDNQSSPLTDPANEVDNGTPVTPTTDSDGDGIPDYKDPEDGTNNETNNGGTAPTYPTGTDTDGDGIIDTNDSDPNNFGEGNTTDFGDLDSTNYPELSSKNFADSDSDNKPNPAAGVIAVWAGDVITYESAYTGNGDASADATGDDGLVIKNTAPPTGTGRTEEWTVTMNSSSATTVYYELRIDWDVDGSFDDVIKGSIQTESPASEDVTVNVPDTYTAGDNVNVRLVAATTEADAAMTTGTIQNGEVEDYQFTSSQVLPVTLVAFDAQQNGNNVDLSWTTSSEINNSHFNVQRSFDGVSYETIGSVSGNGTTTNTSEYSFVDTNVQGGAVHYRLEQVDYDGSTDYSNVVHLNVARGLINIYPNPVANQLTVDYVGDAKVNIYSTLGRLISTETTGQIDMSSYEAGTYIINVVDTNDKVIARETIIVIE